MKLLLDSLLILKNYNTVLISHSYIHCYCSTLELLLDISYCFFERQYNMVPLKRKDIEVVECLSLRYIVCSASQYVQIKLEYSYA